MATTPDAPTHDSTSTNVKRRREDDEKEVESAKFPKTETRRSLIIGVSGAIGSGKNHLVENVLIPELSKTRKVKQLAFADHLKVECITKDKIPFEKIYTSNRDLETRRALQIRGTEEGRDRYGADHWIRTLEAWMKIYILEGFDCFIITDVRFPNELEWISEMSGFVLRTNAPQRTKARVMKEAKGCEKTAATIMGHASETALLRHMDKFSFIVENDYEHEKTVPDQMSKFFALLPK